MVRAPCFDKDGRKKGAWSEEEDNKLRAHIQAFGCRNWRQLPKLAGLSRCGKSCRLRWMNYLRPNMKRGSFTQEEDDVIVSIHNKYGNRWSMMAAKLPGRSDNEIKNHWHTRLKNRVRKTQTVLKNEEVENPEATRFNLKHQEEVEILLTVLSSESPLSSSSSSASEVCPSRLDDSSSDTSVSFPFFESFWSEPFLTDNDVFMSSCDIDAIFSPIFY